MLSGWVGAEGGICSLLGPNQPAKIPPLECCWYCHGKCVSLLGDLMCVFHSECASHRVSGLSTKEGQQQFESKAL